MPGYLEKLEINNFKSYRGKHVVGFTKFSAIIGPNGCGKSNMMDAISFVLGEKTSNLRVKTVKELIHGAPINKPVATTASVSAFYKDTSTEGEEEETVFARKIVGSGTEYRINGKIVHHKEYTQALESIGILIKAKNFLVFQGAVESIAMKTAKERTALFEKISGSGELADKYEKCKQAMGKAEEDTTFSLHKKKGINAEKKEAKAEKEEADKYQRLQQELIDSKLEAQLFKLYHTELDIKKIESELKEFNTDINKMNSKKSAIESELKVKKSDSGRLSREVALKEKAVTEKENELNQKRPLYLKAKQTTQHHQKKVDDAKKAHGKTKKNAEKQRNEIKELERELAEIQELAQNYEAEVSQESQGQSLELMDTQIAEYNRLKERAGKRAAALQSKLDKLNREFKAEQGALDQCKQKQDDFLSRQKDLIEQKQQYLQRIEQCKDYIKANVEKVAKNKEEYEELETTVRANKRRIDEVNQRLEDVQLELNDAKTDNSENTRSQQRAELITNLKKIFPGVIGKLGDLCESANKRYSVAITKVLGTNMDGIIVDTLKTAKECIQYMKEQRIRRETFLPMDILKTEPLQEHLRQLSGTARLVMDVIKYDPAEIKKALLHACGNALVCDTTEEARKLAFGGSERRKTVSIEGNMFNKSGVMSGGLSDIQRKAKRWDNKRIDGMKRERDQLRAELKVLQGDRPKEIGLQDLKSQINGLESRLKYTKRDQETIENQSLKSNECELERIQNKISEVEPEIKVHKENLKKYEREIKTVQGEKNVVDDEIFADFCEQIGVSNIREYEEKQLAAQQERTQKRLEFQKQEDRLKSQLDFVKSHDHKEQLKKLERSIRKFEEEIEKCKEQEKKQLQEIDSSTNDLEKYRLEVQGLKSEHEEKEAEVKDIKKQLTNHVKDESSMQKKISSTERGLEEKLGDRYSLLKTCKEKGTSQDVDVKNQVRLSVNETRKDTICDVLLENGTSQDVDVKNQMDDIKLPLKKGSLNDIEATSSAVSSSQDNDEMEVDGSSSEKGTSQDVDVKNQQSRTTSLRDVGIVIDYGRLDRSYKDLHDDTEVKSNLQELTSNINKLESTLSRIAAPNMKAVDKLDDVQNRLKETNDEFESTRKIARKAKMEFEAVQKERYDKFMDCFEHVSQKIDDIYKELSNNPSAQAFLGAENAEEPYLEGVGYNCVAPGKRFRPMDNLSGGEKTVAALALLFAVHSYQYSPFFVLDEIDAALDNTNINRVANYIKNQTREDFQCIVISLKEEFYTKADSLVGVTCNPDNECTTTETFTLDMRNYSE